MMTTAMKVHVWWRCLFVTSAISFVVTFLAVHMTSSTTAHRNHSTSRPADDDVTLRGANNESHVAIHSIYGHVSKRSAFDNVNSSASIDNVQHERQRLLINGCSNLTLRQWTATDLKAMTDSLFVDDRLRYIYCLVPKVACTSWTRVLFVASGKVKETNPNSISQHEINWHRYKGKKLRPLSWYKQDEITYRLKHYFKFMFVRHPIDRFISAYRDRLLEGEHSNPQKSITEEILSKLLTAQQFANRMRARKRATFKEFIRYVLDPTNPPASANPHWRPQYDICHPCHVQYDFIGHFETLKKDASVVLEKISAAQRVKFPDFDPDNQHQYTTAELKKNLFRKIPASDVERLKTNVYKNDFELFGYK